MILTAGCAQIEAPRGGPADTEPPRVIATFPDSGAVRVPLVDSIAIVFSESMDRSSVESSFRLLPPVEYRERRWDGQTWILRLREPLREDQTYTGLVGTGIRDRQRLSPKEPWSFAFSTGDTLDTGAVAGTVFGQRYPPRGALIYVWPWEAGLPDTLAEGFPPDPVRLGQADGQGAFSLQYLPRGLPLQICAMYDGEQDQRFNPRRDRWGCLDAPILLGDTLRTHRDVDLYLAHPEEPGTVAGALVDSSCVRAQVPAKMRRIQARRDSLREWMEIRLAPDPGDEPEMPAEARDVDDPDSLMSGGVIDAEPDDGSPGAGGGWVRGLTDGDSLRIGQEYLRLDAEEAAARRDSLMCAHPMVARLVDQDSVVVREAYGADSFRWTDVPPGIYRLMGFRDMNENRRADPGEPAVWYPHAIEVRPLRVLDDLDLELPPVLGPLSEADQDVP